MLVEPGNGAVKTEGSGNKRPNRPGPGDRRPIPPRGSVLQPDGVTLAAMASRSVAVQTEDFVNGSFFLWEWLTLVTAVTVISTATQMLDDGRSLHQWRSIQGWYWMEFQKVQHNVQYALNKRSYSFARTLWRRCWSR